jgi:GT2 family glycosyltransferase
MNKLPSVSIIIVNYNGFTLLKNCLKSIFKNNYSNFEIIIVDNNSQDNSIINIQKTFKEQLKQIKIVSLSKNYGPAKARNEGVKKSIGKYLCFLDNDTEVDSNWITIAIKKLQSDNKIGAVQSKLLLLNQKNKIDYVGEILGNKGFLSSIAKYGEIDHHQYDKTKYILAAKSAGMFISRQAFLKAGQFDPDYFIFMEETDLGWRVWLNNFYIVLCPQSIVYHQFSSTKNIVDKDFNNYLVRFHGTKNYIQTLIKNLDSRNLIKILPVHISLWFCLGSFLLITGKFKSGYNIYKGILWNLINIQKTLKKRHQIQLTRKINDDQLFNQYQLMTKTSITDYIKKFFKSQKNINTPENKK